VAVSACLLGEAVRYDGGHKRSALCHDRLNGLFTLEGICPEVGIGMGVPRKPIQLVGTVARPRAVGRDDPSVDVTDALTAYARAARERLRGVSGYIFIKGSPSCGLFRVKVHSEPGTAPSANGRGIYAAEITRLLPLLPVEESGRLEDDVLRENFATRVFAYAHWQRLVDAGITAHGLVAFHSRYKYLLMAHGVAAYREAGRLLADLSRDVDGIAERYIAILMRTLARPATRRGHTNVLHHLCGYFKDRLDGAARQELDAVVQAYRRAEVPLMAPLTLLKHHLRVHMDDYVAMQVYLDPHPPAAALRRSL
jgi:uncharacterized protein YbgA (DUF1722 family)/uncharacterized protein YbbK (DUF523 family)